MRLLSSFVLLTTALCGVSAHPSVLGAHRHAHRQYHETRAVGDQASSAAEQQAGIAARNQFSETYADVVDRSMRFWKGHHPHPASSSTSSSSAAPAASKAPNNADIASPGNSPGSSTSSSSSSSSSSASGGASTSSTSGGAYIPFCGGAATSKRATSYDISYTGNTGAPGRWGCNWQLIPCSIQNLYDYNIKFTVASGSQWTCNCFNKIGPTGLIDGFWNTAVSFTLGAGGEQCIGVDANTQGGCACGPGGSTPKTPMGQWAGTWLEVDMGDAKNGANSGADASVLVAAANGMPFYGMHVANNGAACSWIKSDGSNWQAYIAGTEAADGIGCKGYLKSSLSVTLGD